MKLLDIDKHMMKHAELVGERSRCMSRKVGGILVKDTRIIGQGYNGTPAGYLNCDEGGCKRCASKVKSGTQLEDCLCTHMEANAIAYAARNGIPTEGSTLYTTASPCLTCAKLLISAGIKKVVYYEVYNEPALKLLKDCNIELKQITK